MKLTPMENLVMSVLLATPDMLIEHKEFEVLRAPPPPMQSNRVHVHMKNLRKKLKQQKSPYSIETVRGRGYKLVKVEK